MKNTPPGYPPASRVVPLPSGPEKTDATPTNPFPLEALPPLLRQVVGEGSLAAPAPESLVAAVALGVISASLGGGLKAVSSRGRATGANLYILAFAESGTGKSSAFNIVGRPYLKESERRIQEWRSERAPKFRALAETAKADLDHAKSLRKAAASEADLRAAEASIVEAQRRLDEAMGSLNFEPSLNLGQATSEALPIALSKSPQEANAILSADARDVLGIILGRYAKAKFTDEHVYVQAYSGDPYAVTRVGRPPISIQQPVLTLCLMVQPDMWRRLTEAEAMQESGFLARSLMFDSRARPARPPEAEFSEAAAVAWEDLVLDLLRAFRDQESPAIIAMSPEAEAAFHSLAAEAADKQESGGAWNDIRSFAARLAENATRLAVVLHAATYGKRAATFPLSEGTASAAIRLARWFFEETNQLLAPLRQERLATRLERLADVFRRHRDRQITLRILRDKHGFQEAELYALAAEFPNRLQIRRITSGPQGGRPSLVAELITF